MKNKLAVIMEAMFPGAQEMRLRRFPLQFTDDDTETLFLQDYFEHSLSQNRYSALLAIVALGVFGITDYLFFDGSARIQLLILRFGLGWLGFISFLMYTYTPSAQNHVETAMSITVAWIGVLVLGMVYVGGDVGQLYYVGIILTLMFTYAFLRLRFLYAASVGNLLFVLYVLMQMLLLKPSSAQLWINVLFLSAANGTGMAISYAVEHRARWEFYLRYSLDLQTQQMQEMQQELIEQERRGTFNNLASAIGQEVRELLGVISNSIYYLQITEVDKSASLTEYLGIIGKQVKNGSQLVTSLLEYSREGKPELECMALGMMIPSAVEVANQRSARFSKPTVIVLPSICVMADPEFIIQALARILQNAFEATENETEISVTAQVLGSEVRIDIQDSGPGITAENVARLYDPFFTTKPQSMGLGLPIAKSYIEACGGTIQCVSTLNQGTTFSVTLPHCAHASANDGR